MSFKKVEASVLVKRIDPIIKMRNEDWFLLTSKKGDIVNTMTCAWGTFGNFWEKKIVTIYVRPQRYTREFIDSYNMFTMSFFQNQRDALLFLGHTSGRDNPNKIVDSGLHLTYINDIPTFEEACLVVNCKVLYKQQMDVNLLLDRDIEKSCYPNKDYSIMYVGEILDVYVND